MSQPKFSSPTPLTRLSLLTYLRSSHGHIKPAVSPPVYSKLGTTDRNATATLPRIPEDEETGFWGEHTVPYSDDPSNGAYDYGNNEDDGGEHCCWSFADGFALAVYVGMIIILVLNLDLFLSRWGLGTGVFGAQDVEGLGAQSGTELHFCRTYHGSHGQSTWRLLAPGSNDGCVTESITLFAPQTVIGLNLGDGVLFGAETEEKGSAREIEKEDKIMGGGQMDDNKGDDLAEEGKLRMPPPQPSKGNWLHAGFGGPWRMA
ncbi:hypothetical protein K505DRAFT_421021 [Melanomma pulvis-pyrius CBS 109.77]|uniref:Uncharacterized protein n=1 Tax=Melanomma pulvis-pyrius CBS 109.77 TaxID=1314802 RepID=A0A6A6WWI0_9PLEO|nr:hypothetical protein K505DRAFT_421021 [Melanomma pulvis-pyrius CBS 109.77]